MVVAGIDLGTTTSGIGVVRDGQLLLVSQDTGEVLMPSVVAYSEQGSTLVGVEALDRIAIDPCNTLFDIKRIIGRTPSDPVVNAFRSYVPFSLTTEGGEIRICVARQNGQQDIVSPEQVSGQILAKLKSTAEAKIKEQLSYVVVTVPAYFNSAQREATRNAARLAGLRNMRLLNEPTAVVMAYELENRLPNGTKVLVYDFGGGTFDVSILIKDDEVFEVKCTHGDSHLGGRDFDNLLIDHALEAFKASHNCHDVSVDSGEFMLFRQACEKAKIRLSQSESACIAVSKFWCGIDLSVTITREEFEALSRELISRTIILTQEALDKVNLPADQINIILPVGGSTRIPQVRSMLQELFSRDNIRFCLNPESSVLSGAARCAEFLARKHEEQRHGSLVTELTPFDLGVADHVGRMVRIITANTRLPASGMHYATTERFGQIDMEFDVYEGNNPCAVQNQFLGRFRLTGISRDRAGEPIVRITFHLNCEGMLSVLATDTHTGHLAGLEIRKELSALPVVNGRVEAEEQHAGRTSSTLSVT